MKQEPLAASDKPRFFYGYTVLLAAFLIQVIGWGILNSTGIFFKPLQNDMGWSRAVISGGASLNSLLIGSMSIVVGTLNDRLGPKIVMAASGSVFGLSLLLISRIGLPWQFYIGAAMMGAGGSALDVVLLSTIARWFIKRRGTYSGIAKAGSGVGMLIMPLVAGGLIVAYDWRIAIAALGCIALVGILPLALLLKRDPAQVGQLPDGETRTTTSQDLTSRGLTLSRALHTRQFWTVCAVYLTIVFTAQTMMAHIALHATDLGVTTTVAASVVATIGAASIAGRFGMGSIGDRISYRKAMLVCFVVLAVALVWLQLASSLWMLYLFAVVYGFSHGGFFAVISPLVAGLFGTRAHGTNLGIVIFSGMLGGAIGPLMAGFIFDAMSSYQLAFLILLVVSLTGLVLAASIKPLTEEELAAAGAAASSIKD